MNAKKLVLIAVLGISLILCGYAVISKVRDEKAREYLTRMMEAEKRTTYTATARVRNQWKDKDFTIRFRIYHQAPDQMSYEILEAPWRNRDGKTSSDWRKHHPGRGDSKRDGRRRSSRGGPSIEELKLKLALSEEQATKINKIRTASRDARREFFRKLREDGGKRMDRGKMREEMQKRRETSEKNIREILTQEQRKKYDKLVTSERQTRHRGRMGGGPRRRKWGVPIKDIDLIMKNYDVSIGETEQVAQRRCRKITISPRHPGRPSCTLWIDERRGLLLKYESRNRTFEIESIQFDTPIDDRVFERRRRRSSKKTGSYVRREVSEPEAMRTVSFPVARPSWLPKGFQLYKMILRKWDGGSSLQSLYTDGLEMISLFQSPPGTAWGRSWSWLSKKGNKSKVKAGRYRRGNSTMLTLPLDGVTVTVVSSIPEEELKDLLSSLILSK